MLHRISYYLFMFVILSAPLPFAANRPWSESLLILCIGVIIIIEALSNNNQAGSNRQFLLRISPGILLWSGILFWAWAQSIPGLAAQLAHPLWQETAAIIGRPINATISLDPEATKYAVIRLLAYGSVFWLSARFCRDPEKAALTLKLFVIAAGLYALYGLISFFSGNQTILWFEKWIYLKDLTSTFVNRNSYATFAGLGFIAALARTFDLISRQRHEVLSLRQSVRDFIELTLTKTWLPLSVVFVTAIALLLTHSRGGLLSTSLALLVLLLATLFSGMISRRLGYGLLIITLISGGLFLNLSGDLVLKRLENTSLSSAIRDDVYARVIDSIEANQNLGSGLGTFEHGFMAYKTENLSFANWDMAHNSYLELAMEIGVPATIAVMLSFLWLFGVNLFGLIRRRQRKIYSVIGLATLTLVAAHALVDFSLQIPGLTVTFALLAGLAWAQSWPSARSHRKT